MNEFIEKNRRLLQIYHLAAKIIGWVLIAMAPIFIVVQFLALKGIDEHHSYLMLLPIRDAILSYMFLGLIILGIARFIRYLYEEQSQPGWILRHTEKFLYLYAVLVAVGFLIEFTKFSTYSSQATSYLLIQLIHIASKVLILVGLGHILRRILPVIEESKTLV